MGCRRSIVWSAYRRIAQPDQRCCRVGGLPRWVSGCGRSGRWPPRQAGLGRVDRGALDHSRIARGNGQRADSRPARSPGSLAALSGDRMRPPSVNARRVRPRRTSCRRDRRRRRPRADRARTDRRRNLPRRTGSRDRLRRGAARRPAARSLSADRRPHDRGDRHRHAADRHRGRHNESLSRRAN